MMFLCADDPDETCSPWEIELVNTAPPAFDTGDITEEEKARILAILDHALGVQSMMPFAAPVDYKLYPTYCQAVRAAFSLLRFFIY